MKASTIARDTKTKPEVIFHHLPVKVFVQY